MSCVINLVGRVVGWLTVINLDHQEEKGRAFWKCVCRCGNSIVVSSRLLIRQHKRSCGCLRHRGYFTDLSGKVFGFLTVIAFAGRQGGNYRWLCRCICGKERTADGGSLQRGSKWKSCGCKTAAWLRKDRTEIEKRVYRIWNGMKHRCLNSTAKDYPRYGGRGISVCQRWLSFDNFYADIGSPPSPKHTIERTNNDGNYEPGNCIWGTAKQQQRNKRNTVKITVDGVSKTLAEAAEQAGVPYGLAKARHRAGMAAEDILSMKKHSKWHRRIKR